MSDQFPTEPLAPLDDALHIVALLTSTIPTSLTPTGNLQATLILIRQIDRV
ncbi:hypothetical protein GOD82_24735 [Sinorhizobium medicae]|nr:hypothetical protein [Sinorhizobium medicae]